MINYEQIVNNNSFETYVKDVYVGYLVAEIFKAIFHSSSIIYSICTQPYADVRMGEDLQFTKQSWCFSRKQG